MMTGYARSKLYMSWWFLIIYLVLQLGLSLWLSRKIASETDYFVGGRQLNTGLVAMSLFATWFGAETCLGSSGAIYESGLSGGRADPFGYSLCLLFLGLILAEPIRRGEYITLGDLFKEKFGVGVERLAIWVLIPSSIVWAAAQIKAFGTVVSATTEMNQEVAIYLAAIFVIAYTFFGGLLGDIFTDVIQGTILAISLIVMAGVAVFSLGGVTETTAAIEVQRWYLFPANESFFEQMDRWSVPIMGSLMSQELIARVASCKNEKTARNASYWASGIYLVVGLSPVFIGLIGPQLMPGLHGDETEQLLPRLAEQLLPSFWAAVFSCALISAILSTIDSILLGSSALLSHNLFVPVLGIKTQKGQLACARVLVVVTGVVALVLALHAQGVYELVEAASAFGTAGILVATIAVLYFPKPTWHAPFVAMIVGIATTPLFEYLEWQAPFLSSIAASVIAYVALAMLVKKK